MIASQYECARAGTLLHVMDEQQNFIQNGNVYPNKLFIRLQECQEKTVGDKGRDPIGARSHRYKKIIV